MDNEKQLQQDDNLGWLRQVVAQAETKREQYSHSPQFPKEMGGTAT